MRREFHLKRYKEERDSINLLGNSQKEKDLASITTIAHWASFHLISSLIDGLEIPENLKHRNHRSIKNILKHGEIKAILKENADEILDIYNQIERDYMNPFQYGRAYDEGSVNELVQLLDNLWEIILPHLEGDYEN